jgi:hypothetical protein
MPLTQKTRARSARPAGRSVRITGRKLAGTAPRTVHAVYGLEPRDHVRSIVAMLASSEQQQRTLLDIAQPFLDDIRELSGLPGSGADQLRHFIQQVYERMQIRGVAPSARFRLIQRMGSAEHRGYPLRRTQLVTFNREREGVTAQLREVGDVLKIQGLAIEDNHALRDLERQFERLVQTKVRIPPHAQIPGDRPIVDIVNHLVDWEQFERENPPERPLWGKVLRQERGLRVQVRWLVGPGGIKGQTSYLSGPYLHPTFRHLRPGQWFKASIKEYPEQVEWIEPPYEVPDPENQTAREAAWEGIPTIEASQPNAWPLEE